MFGAVQKLSSLVLWARASVIDTASGQPVLERLLTFRGDNDEFVCARRLVPGAPDRRRAAEVLKSRRPAPGLGCGNAGETASAACHTALFWDPMGFNCGIVGLPNVGKSTLFNALTDTTAAAAANYPFCTIEPNIGRVPVPDPRLDVAGADRQVGQDRADPARDQGHRRPGPRRLQGRGAGQPVPGRHPRGRRGPARAALLRGSATSPMSRAASTRLRDAELIETELLLADLESLERQKDGAGQARPRPGQGGQGAAGAAGPDPARPGGRPAGAHAGPRATTTGELLARLQPADRQARPLCLQRRRGARPRTGNALTEQVAAPGRERRVRATS